MNRKVVCAAIRSADNRIIAGPRHYDSIMIQWFIKKPNWFQKYILRKSFIKDKDWYSCEQGFIDQFGVFMNREEAYWIAKHNNQIINNIEQLEGILYSENLY